MNNKINWPLEFLALFTVYTIYNTYNKNTLSVLYVIFYHEIFSIYLFFKITLI